MRKLLCALALLLFLLCMACYTPPEDNPLSNTVALPASMPEQVAEPTIPAPTPLAFSGTCGMETIILPEGVELVEEGAFDGSKMQRVVLPASLKKIGIYAFSSPTLKEVYFLGLPPEFEEAEDGFPFYCWHHDGSPPDYAPPTIYYPREYTAAWADVDLWGPTLLPYDSLPDWAAKTK